MRPRAMHSTQAYNLGQNQFRINEQSPYVAEKDNSLRNQQRSQVRVND